MKKVKQYGFNSLLAGVLVVASSTATAAVVGFTSNPTGNYTSWAASVSGLGASINSSINFDTHPLGSLQSDFYSDLGVTLNSTGDSSTVVYGSGPGQNNTTSTPLSSGEGPHPASNYLYDGGNTSTFTISFSTPVVGAGLYIIDYFNPLETWDNPLTIEAFDSMNNSLGLFSSVFYNFQSNNMYFMGVSSSTSNIAKLVFTDVNNSTGDITGIDNVVFATSPVPEPETYAMLLAGLGLLSFTARRRKQSA